LTSFSQTKTADLINRWKKAKSEKGYLTDTGSIILLNQLSDQYLYEHVDSALYFAKQALQLAEFQKYPMGKANSSYRIGQAYYIRSDYALSLEASEQLCTISNKINYQAGIGESYQIMGLIYLAQDKLTSSLVEFTKALKIFIKLKDNQKAGKLYFNMGICYDESGQSDKAFYYLDKAIAIAKQGNDNHLLSMALNRTGETYFHLKNYGEALVYYQQVINSKLTSNWEKGFAFSGMAQVFYALGDYNKAILHAQQSYVLSEKVKSQWDAVRALKILSESYAAVKDYKHAYASQLQFKKSNDSLLNIDKEKEIDRLHLRQQQADNIRLKNDIKNKVQIISFSKRLLFFRNLIAVAVIIFVIIIIISNRQKTALNKILQKQNIDIALQKEEISKQKEVLDQLNHTKDQLFSVISHDLRSPFATVLQTIDLIRSGYIPIEDQAAMLEDFYQQVNLVSLMMNNLLIWANSQKTGIKSEAINLDITDAVNGIVSVSNYLAKNKNIKLDHHYKSDKWVRADLDHIKIIVQNLVVNAMKFTPEGGTIEIFYTDDENYLAVHVKDSGIGIPSEKMNKLFKISGKEISGYGTNNEAGAGLGLVLIKQFADANNGKLEVKSKQGEGSEFIVYLRRAENNSSDSYRNSLLANHSV
jgi:signal transduction histidine kinase